MKRFLCGLVALGLFVSGVGQAKSDYTFTTIDVPGSTGTQAFGINDVGVIVGGYFDARGTGHGFALSGGSYTTLDVAGSAFTNANGINNASQIVGRYFD